MTILTLFIGIWLTLVDFSDKVVESSTRSSVNSTDQAQSNAVSAPSPGSVTASSNIGTNANAKAVCTALAGYPQATKTKLAFEKGELSALCRPFVRGERATLDHCGDTRWDPYSSKMTESSFTWPSRREIKRRGKTNLFLDPKLQDEIPVLLGRIEEIRRRTAQTCCADDTLCRQALDNVEVTLCRPTTDENAPDPCVFGGRYEMSGENYSAIYSQLYRLYSPSDVAELQAIPARHLKQPIIDRLNEQNAYQVASAPGSEAAPFEEFVPRGGKIVLSSYVSARSGINALEPVIGHEFGHACSMIRMQLKASGGRDPGKRSKALRALKWFDQVRNRCSKKLELPEAYFDFWESIGESREFASCLYKLTELNRNSQVDRPCQKLCPGHYLEEAVGVAFSLLNGDLSGTPGAAFPNTCDHMRDGQHPLVSDVIECMAQHSPRFRSQLHRSYNCQTQAGARRSVLAKTSKEDHTPVF